MKMLSKFHLLLAIISTLPSLAFAQAGLSVRISSPGPGIVLRPASITNFTVDVSSSTQVAQVKLVLPVELKPTGGSLIMKSSSPPYVFSVPIPSNVPPGTYNFSAIVVDVKGNFASSASLPLAIISASTPTSLKASPAQSVLRYIGDEGKLTVYGIGEAGVSELNSVPGLSCVALDPTVISVSNGCRIVGLRAGSTTLTASYFGATTNVSINVSSSVRGDLTADGEIGSADLEVLKLSIGRVAVPNDARDLNGDGKIDALDLRVLTTLCTRPRCAVQ